MPAVVTSTAALSIVEKFATCTGMAGQSQVCAAECTGNMKFRVHHDCQRASTCGIEGSGALSMDIRRSQEGSQGGKGTQEKDAREGSHAKSKKEG